MKKISFVIPCYNSEKTIESVVDEIDKVFLDNNAYEYEILLVNDASPKDNTWGEIKRISRINSRVTAIQLSKNFGQDSALMAGYSVSKGDYIISLDDDGQNPAAEARKLLAKMEEGYDVVFGRYKEKKHSRFKNFGSKVNDVMAAWLLGKPKDLALCSYFIMNRFVVDEMLKDRNSFPYIWGLILRSTDRMANVYLEHRERLEGKSNFTLIKSLKVWFNGFIAFSVKPLRFSAILGMVTALIGFLYGLYIVLRQLIYGDIMAGWSSLMAAILLLGGVNLIMLGLVGEYVGRMNISVNNTPQFIIRDIYTGDEVSYLTERGD